MALFQHSVLNKYLQELHKQQIETAYNKFISNFGNPDKQNNIRASKEEQYQEGFLIDLFVNVLGYTKNPEPNFNLTTEYKNEKDAKKADGAILREYKPIAIIELKGTDTIDLDTIEQQAFNYKNNQSNCKYIITSNFEKLRFYIENAIEYEEFNLFNLSKDSFSLLFLCLSKDNLLNDIPIEIKQASITQEENITKKLYSDYSTFKHLIFSNIIELNPQLDKLLLYKKTQKLLDRFLFIFFAEDRLLLPPNSIREILKQWERFKEEDVYFPLYDRFKKYFNYLNVGHKGKAHEIFAYNGGLFEPDEILDNIKIEDDILFIHTQKLSDYDFETDVDVNILGHIFEHSLGEIEEVQAELEGQTIEKNKTRRKKDGIFYTPKYITKYIVNNTLGVLCDEKKKELEINEDEFSFEKRKARRKELIVKLDIYRNWLLKLTICDPACGSGAFLNQALNYLIEEHKIIDELQAKVSGASIIFPDIENKILENNLYGVDLNEESVEIAKLSLWLRTAHKGRKLTSLSNNIKCGNSLIDDPEVAGEKAFNWFLEFPQVFPHYRKPKPKPVNEEPEPGDREFSDEMQEPSFSYKTKSKGFEKHGFDVVIGNPPYVFAREKITEQEKKYYTSNFISAKYQVNTYLLFIEKTIKIIKDNGYYGLIVPNAWLMVSSASNLRNYILKTSKLKEIINLSGYSFVGVNVETIIIAAQKNTSVNNIFSVKMSKGEEFVFSHNKLQENFIKNEGFEFKVFSNDISDKLLAKIGTNSDILEDVSIIKAGIQAYEAGKGNPKQTQDDVKNRPYDYTYKFDETTYPYLDGKDVNRYYINWNGLFLKYGNNLAAPRTLDLFSGKKIVVREITGKYPKSIIANYTEEFYLFNRSNIAIIEKPDAKTDLKYLLTLLNSNLISYYFLKNTPKSVRQMFPKVILQDLRKFPVKIISKEEQNPFIEKANIMLSKTKELQELKTKFIKLLSSKYNDLKITNKLEDWTELDFKGFSKELEKQKIKLSLSEQSEWIEYFEKEKAKAQEIKSIIEKTDKEIDNMVYTLYELTPEEIKIVEGK